MSDYGRWGYELSRYSGLWSALKIVTNVADGYSMIKVGPGRVQPSRPEFEWDGQAHKGREALARFAAETYANSDGQTRHWYTNLVITPTPDGAHGRVYVLAGRDDDDGPPRLSIAAMYWNDVIVKTADGWRFKHRSAV